MRKGQSCGGEGLLAFLGGLALLTIGLLGLFGGVLAGKAGATAAAQAESPPPGGTPVVERGPVPVPDVDLDHFTGTWYVIATLPDRFLAGCAAEATVSYTWRPDRRLTVQNRCRGADDSIHLDEGLARVGDPAGPASRLEVSFTPDWLAWMPLAWSEVWIIGLDAGYRYALMATPDREHLWLLSRSPVLGEPDVERLLGMAREQGFDLGGLRRIPQEGDSATSVEDGAELPAP